MIISQLNIGNAWESHRMKTALQVFHTKTDFYYYFHYLIYCWRTWCLIADLHLLYRSFCTLLYMYVMIEYRYEIFLHFSISFIRKPWEEIIVIFSCRINIFYIITILSMATYKSSSSSSSNLHVYLWDESIYTTAMLRSSHWTYQIRNYTS